MYFKPLSQAFTLWPLDSIRLIATDMDGTLTYKGEFTAELLQSLVKLRARGIQVVIVTGRSAGWVSGLVSYLPIAGAIAENGGLFYGCDSEQSGVPLVAIADLQHHRQQLAQMFAQLRVAFPQLQAAADNAFRITDWTFPNPGFYPEQLQEMGAICQSQGWDLTYSTVQCHIKLPIQNKREGLLTVLKTVPDLACSLNQVITVGDSPNDAHLFDPKVFPHSVGVANSLDYADQMEYCPAYVTDLPESEGFCQLARLLLQD